MSPSVTVEGGPGSRDVDGLLNTPLEPPGLSVQDGNTVLSQVMSFDRRQDVVYSFSTPSPMLVTQHGVGREIETGYGGNLSLL